MSFSQDFLDVFAPFFFGKVEIFLISIVIVDVMLLRLRVEVGYDARIVLITLSPTRGWAVRYGLTEVIENGSTPSLIST